MWTKIFSPELAVQAGQARMLPVMCAIGLVGNESIVRFRNVVTIGSTMMIDRLEPGGGDGR